jgi:hypothetical protein
VEGYFFRQGLLLPAYHQIYWLGLQSRAVKQGAIGTFNWLDGSVKPPSMDTYSRWVRGPVSWPQCAGRQRHWQRQGLDRKRRRLNQKRITSAL